MLEELLEKTKDKWLETSVRLAESPVYRYSVDVLSGWLYYTPTYAAQEVAAGKDLDSIIKTRVLGMVAQAIAMRPVGLLRNHIAHRWNVTAESPLIDKVKVNITAVTPVQSVVYAGLLAGGMVWSGEYDWKQSTYAWIIGTVLGAAHATIYGPVQDKIRSAFGIKPAIANHPEEKKLTKKSGKYRLLGIPDNLEEFIDKLHHKGIIAATVKSKSVYYEEFNYYIHLPPETHQYITVEADKYTLRLNDEEHSATYESGHYRGYHFIGEKLQRASLQVARQLEQSGLSTTLESSEVWENPNQLTTKEAERIHTEKRKIFERND